MFLHGKTLMITLLAVIAMGTVTGNRDCAKDCVTQFQCNPFYEYSVWSIVDGICEVFKNPCVFNSVNCSRQRQCLKPLKQVSQEKCQKKCGKCNGTTGPKYCVTFMYNDELGEGVVTYKEFANKCFADQYACQNALAYITGTDC